MGGGIIGGIDWFSVLARFEIKLRDPQGNVWRAGQGGRLLDAGRMIESSGRRKLNLCEFVPAPRILLVKH